MLRAIAKILEYGNMCKCNDGILCPERLGHILHLMVGKNLLQVIVEITILNPHRDSDGHPDWENHD